jgi:hypothetical protein
MTGAILELILAAEESLKKSDRLASAWARKRAEARDRKPISKRGPLWLQLSEDRTTWEVIPERAAIVQRIFRETADGIGSYRLAAIFNEEGVASFENRPYWSQKAIHRVLINPSVRGLFQPQRMEGGKPTDEGDPVADYFPRVVSDDLWHAAHRQLRAKRTGGRKAGGRTGRAFLFQKLTWDADTDSTLVVRSTRGGKGRGYIRYLVSSAGLRGGRRNTVPLDDFERVLLAGLSEIQPAEVVPPQGKLEEAIRAGKAHMANLTAQIDATTAAMAAQPPDLLGGIVAQVAAWTKERREWVGQLEELQARLDRQSDPVTELKAAVKMPEGDDQRVRLRGAVRALVKRVWVRIIPGRTRLEKSVRALVQFNDCDEARLFIFTVPGDGCSVVLKGWTLEELAKM